MHRLLELKVHLHLVENHLPDAIILDLKLPGIDGWSVLEQLKENIDAHEITWTKDMEKQAARIQKEHRSPCP